MAGVQCLPEWVHLPTSDELLAVKFLLLKKYKSVVKKMFHLICFKYGALTSKVDFLLFRTADKYTDKQQLSTDNSKIEKYKDTTFTQLY